MECTVCVEPFDERERRPKVLPCGHTFCVSCVPSFRNLCPMDRKEFSQHYSQLPDNHQLLNVKRASDFSQNNMRTLETKLFEMRSQLESISNLSEDELACMIMKENENTSHRFEISLALARGALPHMSDLFDEHPWLARYVQDGKFSLPLTSCPVEADEGTSEDADETFVDAVKEVTMLKTTIRKLVDKLTSAVLKCQALEHSNENIGSLLHAASKSFEEEKTVIVSRLENLRKDFQRLENEKAAIASELETERLRLWDKIEERARKYRREKEALTSQFYIEKESMERTIRVRSYLCVLFFLLFLSFLIGSGSELSPPPLGSPRPSPPMATYPSPGTLTDPTYIT